MARFTGMRRALVQAVGAVGVALLLGQGVLAAHAAPAAARVSLIGVWLDNAIGVDPRQCGQAYGQFTFFRNGEYAYTENSEYYDIPLPSVQGSFTRGGITNAGYYALRNGVLYLHWVECNFPCAPGTASARIAFINAHAFEILDAGQAYDYYRQ
jgi:hypothetical protein